MRGVKENVGLPLVGLQGRKLHTGYAGELKNGQTFFWRAQRTDSWESYTVTKEWDGNRMEARCAHGHSDKFNAYSTVYIWSTGEFSVYWWDNQECPHEELRFVDGETAVRKVFMLINCPATKLGWIKRIVVTDGGDCTNVEWLRSEGIVFPPELKGLGKPK